MDTETLETINQEISHFETISLSEMEGVSLMNRVDVKFLVPLHLLPSVLKDATQHYKLLQINNERICAYKTLYYDTIDYKLYHSHQAGKLNRYKVRFRNYVDSNLSFFEVKHQNNKGRTQKTRIKQPNVFKDDLSPAEVEFLEKNTPLAARELKGNIMVDYKRMTLVSKTSKERLTVDLDLTFSKEENKVAYQQVVVVEVKQEKLSSSPILDIFKKYRIKSGSISKYCLGVMSIDLDVKRNRFKNKFLHLKKIIRSYDNFARVGQ